MCVGRAMQKWERMCTFRLGEADGIESEIVIMLWDV